jgi:hypothetical protein
VLGHLYAVCSNFHCFLCRTLHWLLNVLPGVGLWTKFCDFYRLNGGAYWRWVCAAVAPVAHPNVFRAPPPVVGPVVQPKKYVE